MITGDEHLTHLWAGQACPSNHQSHDFNNAHPVDFCMLLIHQSFQHNSP